MKTALAPTLVTGLLGLCAIDTPAAGNPNAKVLLHLTRASMPTSRPSPVGQPACTAALTSGALYPNRCYAHPLVAEGDAMEGIGSVFLGIDDASGPSNGVVVNGWTNCECQELSGSSPAWPVRVPATPSRGIPPRAASVASRADPGRES